MQAPPESRKTRLAKEARHTGRFKNKPTLTVTIRNQSGAIRDTLGGGADQLVAPVSGESGWCAVGHGSGSRDRWGFLGFSWVVDDWGAPT